MTFANYRKQLRRDFIKELKNVQPVKQSRVFKPNPGAQSKALKILTQEHPYAFCIWGGIGSGKTTTGCFFLISQCLHFPDRQKLILAGSFDQLQSSSLTALARFCQDYGVPISPDLGNPQDTANAIANRRFCHINGNPVRCSTADHFSGGSELGRGQELRTIWFDEADYHADAFKSLLGRFPRGPGKGGTFLCTSSINYRHPFDGLFPIFQDPNRTPEQKKQFRSIIIPTKQNLYLDEDYYNSLSLNYTPERAAIELEGKFIRPTMDGLVFCFFNYEKHVLNPQFNQTQPIILSFDFNINPATAIAAFKDKDSLIIIKEWRLPNTSTFELAQHVIDWLLERQIQHIILCGDASGKNRSAASRTSNFDILMEAFSQESISLLFNVPSKNPYIDESVNLVNRLFRQHRIKLYRTCRYLITDLQVQTWKQAGKLDKSDIQTGHLADCLRYLAWAIINNSSDKPAELL